MPCAVTHARLTRRRTQWCVGNTRAGFVRRAVGVTFHQPLLRVAVLADGTVAVPTLFAPSRGGDGSVPESRAGELPEGVWVEEAFFEKRCCTRAWRLCLGAPQARRI